MTILYRIGITTLIAVLGYAGVSIAFSDEPRSNKGAAPSSESAGDGDLSINVARQRAVVAQDIYSATLRTLHRRYFHKDKAVLPARAMQDIFDDVESESKVKAQWISASLKPMSIDHTPETAFEKQAAKEIAAGTPHIEIVEDGYYRRAVAIPLTGGCLGCHEGMFQNDGRKKFAGLVVSLPIQDTYPEAEVREKTPE
jgi:hypothetical protein